MFGRFLPFWILLEKKLAVWATFKINNCQFCHLSGYFQIPLLNFFLYILISEPLEYIPCTCKYDLKSFNSNSCHCFPKCNVAALPLEIEVIRCDPIVRGRRNSCRHCAVAWTSTAQLWMKVGRWNASRTWFQFLEFRLMFQHVPTGSLMIFDTFLTSYLLAVKNEFSSLFFFEAVWDALILWSSMIISNIEVNGPAFDGWRQSRTDPKPGRFMKFRFVGPLSGPEVEEVIRSWFQLVWLNTSSPQKRNPPKMTFPIQTLEGKRGVFLGTTRGVTGFLRRTIQDFLLQTLWH